MANEQTSVPLFVADTILTAAQQNISAGTGVPVFATTVTRDAAFGGASEKVLAEGQLCYLSSTNVVQQYNGSGWETVGPAAASAILQLKTVQKTDSFTTTSTSYTDLTTLTLSITPSSASNKVLIGYAVQTSGTIGVNMGVLQIVRTSTAIGNADAAGSRSVGNVVVPEIAAAAVGQVTNWYLDSPATTSATTYKLQIRATTAGTVFVNRNNTDTDNAFTGRGTSSLLLMEISV